MGSGGTDPIGDLLMTLPAAVTAAASFAGLLLAVATAFFARSRLIEDSEKAKSSSEEKFEVVWSPKAGDKVAQSETPEAQATAQHELIKQYHRQGLAQATISFWFSLIFATLGFLLIVSAVAIALQAGDISKEWFKGILPLLSGTIVEAVAGLFFVQSNKTRELMAEFFDKLRTDRKLDESLRLAAEIQDKRIGATLRAYMALRFADLKLTDSAFRSIIDASEESSNTDQQTLEDQ